MSDASGWRRVCDQIECLAEANDIFFLVGSWNFCRHLKLTFFQLTTDRRIMAESGEAVESDGEEWDSGASIMSRGGKHGDTSTLGKMMRTVQDWVDKQLTSAQIQTEAEGGEKEDEDDEEVGEVRASGAGAAATQGPLGQQRAGGAARQAASAKDKDADPSTLLEI
jgi:hypothetical protein